MRWYSVKYRGQGEFRDMCAGVPFSIKHGEEKQIDEIAARHIFGLGEPDKRRALIRLGWLQHQGKTGPGCMDEAMAMLGSFVFTELQLTPAKADGNSDAKLLQTASSPSPA